MITPQSDAPFPPTQDTLFQVTRRETKPNGYQRDGEHGGKGGGGRNGKGDGNAAEGTAMVEAEVVKIAAGAAVSKIKVAKITNPAIRPLAPTAISG